MTMKSDKEFCGNKKQTAGFLTSYRIAGNFAGANFRQNAKMPIVFIFAVFIFA